MKANSITLPLSQRSGASSPHASPIIAGLAEAAKPNPFPACGDCPRSDWLIVSKGLKCYCTAYHRISWEDPLNEWGTVMACDARETAIAELNERQSQKR